MIKWLEKTTCQLDRLPLHYRCQFLLQRYGIRLTIEDIQNNTLDSKLVSFPEFENALFNPFDSFLEKFK